MDRSLSVSPRQLGAADAGHLGFLLAGFLQEWGEYLLNPRRLRCQAASSFRSLTRLLHH